jgi:hypothetical protein
VHTLVTIGAPIGVRPLFFDQLRSPMVNGCRSWPAPLVRWVNIAHPRDRVTAVRHLRPLFGNGAQVEDIILHPVADGPHPHSLWSYLAAYETRSAISLAAAGTLSAVSSAARARRRKGPESRRIP